MINLRINVVPSYADDIPVSGESESFNGLTGMILQVADMISCAPVPLQAYLCLLMGKHEKTGREYPAAISK